MHAPSTQPGFFKQPATGLACRWLCAGLVALACGIDAAADSIRVKRSAKVISVTGDVMLKDIAVLQGADIAKHGDLVIASFGPNQKTLTLAIQTIRTQLQKADVPMGGISLQGHRACVVIQQAVEKTIAPPAAIGQPAKEINTLSAPPVLAIAPIEPSSALAAQTSFTLNDVVIDAVAQGLNARPEEVRITAEGLGAVVLNQAVSDPRAYRIIWPGFKHPGKALLKIQRLHAERIVETHPIHVLIKQRVMAVCPKDKNLPAGTRIYTRHLATTPVWIDHDPRELLANAKEAAGQRLLSAVPQDQAIRIDQLPKPVLIRRGDIVDVRTYVGNLEVSVRARATKDGKQGERIGFTSANRSRNTQTFSATVTSPGVAIVTAPGSLTPGNSAPGKGMHSNQQLTNAGVR